MKRANFNQRYHSSQSKKPKPTGIFAYNQAGGPNGVTLYTSGVKANTTGYLFCGGTAVEFVKAQAGIRNRFMQVKDGWEQLTMPEGEIEFTTPPPVDTYVEDHINLMTERYAADRIRRVDAIHAAGLNAAERNKQLLQAEETWHERMLALQAQRPTLEARLHTMKIDWKKENREFQELKGNLTKVFTETFGGPALGVINPFLARGEYRGAWKALQLHYCIAASGNSASATIKRAMAGMVYDGTKSNLVDHIFTIQEYCRMLNDLGGNDVFGEQSVMDTVMDSLKRSPQFAD